MGKQFSFIGHEKWKIVAIIGHRKWKIITIIGHVFWKMHYLCRRTMVNLILYPHEFEIFSAKYR